MEVATARNCLELAVTNMGLSNRHWELSHAANRAKLKVRAREHRLMAEDYRRIAGNYEMLATELAKLGA